MDYIVTFEDGSSACLAHYGVSGMKWGKWSPETQAKYARASNGTYYKLAQRGSEYGKAVTNKRREYNALQPKAKQIAKNILLGPAGAHAYNTARSRGLSRSESMSNAGLGIFYAQGVKEKQKNLGTTKVKLSNAATRRQNYEKGQSAKKDIAKALLLGTSAPTYNSIRESTKSRGKAILGTVLSTAASGYVPFASQLPRAYAYYKYDYAPYTEGKHKIKKKK